MIFFVGFDVISWVVRSVFDFCECRVGEFIVYFFLFLEGFGRLGEFF